MALGFCLGAVLLTSGCHLLFSGVDVVPDGLSTGPSLSGGVREAGEVEFSLIETGAWSPPEGARLEVAFEPGPATEVTVEDRTEVSHPDRIRGFRDCPESTLDGCRAGIEDSGEQIIPGSFHRSDFTAGFGADALRNAERVTIRWPERGAVWTRRAHSDFPTRYSNMSVSIWPPENGTTEVRITLSETRDWLPPRSAELEVELSPVASETVQPLRIMGRRPRPLLSHRDCGESERSGCSSDWVVAAESRDGPVMHDVFLRLELPAEQRSQVSRVTVRWPEGDAVWSRSLEE